LPTSQGGVLGLALLEWDLHTSYILLVNLEGCFGKYILPMLRFRIVMPMIHAQCVVGKVQGIWGPGGRIQSPRPI